MNIKIVTGKIHSGKTTWLIDFSENNRDVTGIISPVINEKRFFVDIQSGETKLMEAGPDENDILEIGRFEFSANAFQWAEEKIVNAINMQPEYLIIDEIGPLELQGKGFSKIVKEILIQTDLKFTLILVVRDSILDEVINHFNISKNDLEIIEMNR